MSALSSTMVSSRVRQFSSSSSSSSSQSTSRKKSFSSSSSSSSRTTTKIQRAIRAQAIQQHEMTEGGVLLPTGLYCPDTTQTFRRKTRTIQIGNVKVGSDHPIVKQTMTTSDTRDVNATVNEIMRCTDAGAEMVRITVQGMQEAKACQEIKNKLLQSGYTTPIIADIHFSQKSR